MSDLTGTEDGTDGPVMRPPTQGEQAAAAGGREGQPTAPISIRSSIRNRLASVFETTELSPRQLEVFIDELLAMTAGSADAVLDLSDSALAELAQFYSNVGTLEQLGTGTTEQIEQAVEEVRVSTGQMGETDRQFGPYLAEEGEEGQEGQIVPTREGTGSTVGAMAGMIGRGNYGIQLGTDWSNEMQRSFPGGMQRKGRFVYSRDGAIVRPNEVLMPNGEKLSRSEYLRVVAIGGDSAYFSGFRSVQEGRNVERDRMQQLAGLQAEVTGSRSGDWLTVTDPDGTQRRVYTGARTGLNSPVNYQLAPLDEEGNTPLDERGVPIVIEVPAEQYDPDGAALEQSMFYESAGRDLSERRNARLLGDEDQIRTYRETANRTLDGMTFPEILAWMAGLSEDDLIAFQHKLWRAGFYGDGKPQWGLMSELDVGAFDSMVTAKINYGQDQSFDSFWEDMYAREAQYQTDEIAQQIADMETNLYAQVTDDMTLDSLIDQVSFNLLGQAKGAISPEQREQIKKSIQSQEYNHFLANDPSYLAAKEEQALIAQGPANDSTVTAFANAIMSGESGGDPSAVNPHSGAWGLFQFMPQTWATVTSRYGFDPNDRSPENQWAVATTYMNDLYGRFGNWWDVAVAWYAGENSESIGTYGRATSHNSAEQANDHPSIRKYADDAINRFNANMTGQAGGVSGAGVPAVNVHQIETLPSAEALIQEAIKNANPEEYGSELVANQGREFFNMLLGAQQG